MTTTTTISTTDIDELVSGMSRDEAIISMVSEFSISINKATKLYKQYASDYDLSSGVVSHKKEALSDLNNSFNESNWSAEAVAEAVIELSHKYNVAESTARDYTKEFSKLIGVQHPTADPRTQIFNWFASMKENGNEITKEDFISFAESIGRSRSNANEYWKGYELHLFLSAQ